MNEEQRSLIIRFLEAGSAYLQGGYLPPLKRRASLAPFLGMESRAEGKPPLTPANKAETGAPPVTQKEPSHPTPAENAPILALILTDGPAIDGPGGTLLDRALAAIDLLREVNCRVLTLPGASQPEALASFIRELEIHPPRAILYLEDALETRRGSSSLGAFLEEKSLAIDLPPELYGIPLVATHHPNRVLENESLKRPLWEDLKSLRAKLGEEP